MTLTMWILLACLVVCVGLSAFFSASETAFSAANRIKLKTMAQDGHKAAETALALSEDYDRLITTILIGNNLVNIAGTSIATVLFTGLFGDMGPTLSTIVMTLLILLFGEVSPKTLAKESPEHVAVGVAGALRIMTLVFKPINAVFVLWKRLISRIFHPKKDDSDIEDELMTMVDEAASEGDMDRHESELIRSAIEFTDQEISSILTPRVDVTAIEDTSSCDEAAEIFRQSGYSRLPVYHEDLDHIVGILHEKDFYNCLHFGVKDIKQMMKTPVFAPSTLESSKLLKLFQSSHTHLVVVVDEFGGTEGIVTMEDVLEELVGDIFDEHDDVEQEVIAMDDGSMDVDGGMQLSELLDMYNIDDTFEADTVGGWAGEMLGCIPEVADTFTCGMLQVTVKEMDKRRVTLVHIEPVKQEEKPESPENLEENENQDKEEIPAAEETARK